MLARKSTLMHPLGVRLETPLLVPAFSSKGFQFTKENISEISEALATTSEIITDSMLISAYDIKYNHIPSPDALKFLPEIIFVDSGGYETLDAHDLSAVFRHACPINDWNEKYLSEVFDKWPAHQPAIFISYDHGSQHQPLENQIDAAKKLFANYPKQMHELIIKPESKEQRTLKKTICAMQGLIEEFAHFDIIGVTEKELGGSILERMQNIAKIRLMLDDAKIMQPLHIFGSLDPLTSPLYFLAGAEIFDGLTWLRYSFYNGQAIYCSNYGAIEIGIHERDSLIKVRSIVDNIYYIRRLEAKMENFLLEKDYSKFEINTQLLKDSYDTLCTKIGRRV